MRVPLGALIVSVVLAACDGQPPTVPGPALGRPSKPPAPPPAAPTYTVSGVVSIGNMPVEGARVAVLPDGVLSATTDDDGFYSISGVPSSYELMAPLLSASKRGYFSDIRFANSSYAPIAGDTRLNFNLAPWLSIAVGEIVTGRLDGSDPECSHWGYGSGACRRFAVTAPANGSLEVTVTAPVFDFDVDIVGPDGRFVLYDPVWAPVRRFVIGAESGSTYQIRLIGGCCPVREFELRTALH